MGELSDHTKLMNIVLALSSEKIQGWPNEFWKVGYNKIYIEPNIRISFNGRDNKTSNPDILLFSSEYKHFVIIDCKSRTLKDEQTQKYIELKKNPKIIPAYVPISVSNPQNIISDCSFVSFYEDICNNSLVISENIPILHVIKQNDSEIVEKIELKVGHFQNSKLNSVFPISINAPIPNHLYPFDIHKEDWPAFVEYVLRELIRFAINNQKFNEEMLLKNAHKYWDYIDSDKKKSLKKRVRYILVKLRDGKLKNYLKKEKENKENKMWFIDIDSDKKLQSFISLCYSCIEELKKDSGKQLLLDDVYNK
ncbi:hypothetical protein [Methanocaldococcus sp.]|uniref:hypothetical protein n=1 Tax=Methanocaldococcus sp. TaxID=2152917 RepID=UPI0026275B01|nr:hypothetical protein [Methanocaldococcus sp.]MCQ6254741.1 hypothetical protein [Methanocaldococcus sp.]